MVAVPPLGSSSVQSILIVVVLPAPFGPSRPKISPARMSKLTPSTATCHSVGARSRAVSLDQNDRDRFGFGYRLRSSRTRTTTSDMLSLLLHPPLGRDEGSRQGRRTGHQT